jgi:hypothetical protein
MGIVTFILWLLAHIVPCTGICLPAEECRHIPIIGGELCLPV